MTTWILVANQSVARLFERSDNDRNVVAIQTLHHPEGRLHEGDLVTDKGAAVHQSLGRGQERSTGPEVSATEQEANVFADELAEHLRLGRSDGRYQSLELVCAPEFLGRLREALDDATARLVGATVDKNIADQPERELETTLGELLPR